MKKVIFTVLAALGCFSNSFAADWNEIENYATNSSVTVSSVREGRPEQTIDGISVGQDGCSTEKNPYTINVSDGETILFDEKNWFLFDLGAEKELSIIEIDWRDNHAYQYDIYISSEPFEISPVIYNGEVVTGSRGYPYNHLTTDLSTLTKAVSGGSGNEGDATPHTDIMTFTAAKGRYILVYCEPNNHAKTWGCGILDIRMGFIEEEDDILSVFNVSPTIFLPDTETVLSITAKNQHGVDIDISNLTFEVSENATLNENKITINGEGSATITAQYDNSEISITLYAASSPATPELVGTPVYTNGDTSFNSTAGFQTGYNGKADDKGNFEFADGNVARLFCNTGCVFFYNSATTGGDISNVFPIEKGWQELHLSVFSSKDVDGYIAFEGIQGTVPGTVGSNFNFSLISGEWNDIVINVSAATKLNNMSIRFKDNDKCDILLANIYFTQTPDNAINLANLTSFEWQAETILIPGFVSEDDSETFDLANDVIVKIEPKGFNKFDQELNLENSGLPEWHFNQLKAITEAEYDVDAFLFNDPEIELLENGDLSISVDCSGLYNISFSSEKGIGFTVNNDEIILSEVSFDVMVYPTLKNRYTYDYKDKEGKEHHYVDDGITINGFQSSSSSYGEGIQHPQTEEGLQSLSNATIIIPGVYGAKIYYATEAMLNGSSKVGNGVKRRAAENDLPEGYENYVAAGGTYGNVLDLSDLAENGGTVNLVLSKNGAITPLTAGVGTEGSSQSQFNVVLNKEVSTGVESIVYVNNDSSTEYYDINGLKVNPSNLQKGLYIVRNGNQTSKVVIR